MFFFGIIVQLGELVHKKLNLQGSATLRLNVKIFNDKTALWKIYYGILYYANTIYWL